MKTNETPESSPSDKNFSVLQLGVDRLPQMDRAAHSKGAIHARGLSRPFKLGHVIPYTMPRIAFKVFPNAEAVNNSLRGLAEIIRRQKAFVAN